MKKSIAYLNFNIETECPNCGYIIDLVYYEEGNDPVIIKSLFNNKWSNLNYEVTCPNCEREFIVNDIEH